MFWQLEQFRFDPATNVLAGPTGQRLLEPKPSALLTYLLENPGRDISRDELLENIWDGHIVTDGAINRVVVNLRKALGDDDKIRKFIVTVPKTGYRFVGSATRTTAPAKPKLLRLKFSMVVGAAIVLCGLVLFSVSTLWREEPKSPDTSTITVAPVVRLAGEQFDPAVTHDGLQFAFSQKAQTGSVLYWKYDAISAPTPIGDQSGNARSAAWAPDGKSLAYQFFDKKSCSFHQILFSGTTASSPIRLYDCAIGSISTLAYSRDGTKLFFTEHPGEYEPASVFEIDLASGSKRRLSQPVAQGRGNHYLDVHPLTGDLLILSDQRPGRTTAYSLNPDDESFTRLTSWAYRVDYAVWSHEEGKLVHPDGHPSYQLIELNYVTGAVNTLVSDSRRIKSPKRLSNSRDYMFVSYLHDRDIWIDGAADTSLNSSVMDYLPTLSRKGDQIAFVSKRSGNSQILVKEFASVALRPITVNQDFLSIVALDWSFDDSLLLATTSQGLHVFDAATGATIQTVTTDLPAYGATWTSEQMITYSQREAGVWQQYTADLATGEIAIVDGDWAFALTSNSIMIHIDQLGEASFSGETPVNLGCIPFLAGRHTTYLLRESSLYCISAQSPRNLLKITSPDRVDVIENAVTDIRQYGIANNRQAHTVLTSSVSDIMRTNRQP